MNTILGNVLFKVTSECEKFICESCVQKLRVACYFKCNILQAQKAILSGNSFGMDYNEDSLQDSLEDTITISRSNEENTDNKVDTASQDIKKCCLIKKERNSYVSSTSETEIKSIAHNGKKKEVPKKGQPKIKKKNRLENKVHIIKLPNQGRNLPYRINRTSLTCEICNAKYMQFRELQMHMPTHFPDYICHICGRLFPNEFHLKIHQKCHSERDLKCEHCGKMFKTKGTLQQHMNIIHLGLKKQYKCFCCNDSFPTYYLRVKHMIASHGMEGNKFKCNMCPRKFDISNHLQEHIRKQHLNVRPFKCDKCPYKGHTNWALKQHYISHTGEKSFRCEICFKSYGRRNTLQEHIKMHKAATNVCSICDKAFLSKQHLEEHLSSHCDETYGLNNSKDNQQILNDEKKQIGD